MLKTTKTTKIYILCPANAETGGPEALYTLGYELRKLGFDSYMFHNNSKFNENLIVEKYKKFNMPFVTKIEDDSNNILIIPETSPRFLYKYKKIQKAFWWLSVDNYFTITRQKEYRGFQKIFRKIFPKKVYKVDFNDNKIVHFAQSYYAMDFIKQNNAANSEFLMDYLSDEIWEYENKCDYTKKENIILYNPKKGYEFTKQIIEKAPDLTFVPLINLRYKEVIDLLLRSKVYIDFGNHPGKDRFPREAAILGNIVITNKKGAAKYFEDVPIPEKYKFDDDSSNIDNIVKMLRECLETYDSKINDFSSYRDFIHKDKENFINDIKQIFIKDIKNE